MYSEIVGYFCHNILNNVEDRMANIIYFVGNWMINFVINKTNAISWYINDESSYTRTELKNWFSSAVYLTGPVGTYTGCIILDGTSCSCS